MLIVKPDMAEYCWGYEQEQCQLHNFRLLFYILETVLLAFSGGLFL